MANVAKLLMLQGGKCFYCGNKLALDEATVDHVIAKALGGDNSEGNTVACCHSINQAFGNATPKEKLAALINAGGRIECPPKPARKPAPVAAESSTQQPKSQPAPQAAKKATPPKQPQQKPTPEIKPSSLRKPMQEAFQAAAEANGGDKALLTTVSVELRKKIPDFVVKRYGEKTFAKLVAALGYRVEKHWCSPPKVAAKPQ
jgi:hypothetical protein